MEELQEEFKKEKKFCKICDKETIHIKLKNKKDAWMCGFCKTVQ
jgi:ribosomal protein S27AE